MNEEELIPVFTTVVGGKTGKSANFPGMGENL